MDHRKLKKNPLKKRSTSSVATLVNSQFQNDANTPKESPKHLTDRLEQMRISIDLGAITKKIQNWL